MKKQVRNFEVNYSIDWTYGVSLTQIREDIDALEKLGATSVDIEIYSEYGSDYVGIMAFALREETDEECLAREQMLTAHAEKMKEWELTQLEALKLKYGQ